MRFLVVKPKGPNLSIIQFAGPDDQVTTPFESWALDTGPKIEYADRKLHKDLDKYHLGGNFQQGAMYAYTYEELVLILSGKLGQCDRVVLEVLQAKQDKSPPNKDPKAEKHFRKLVSTVGFGTVKVLFVVLYRTVFMLVVFTIVPLIIRAFSKHRR